MERNQGQIKKTSAVSSLKDIHLFLLLFFPFRAISLFRTRSYIIKEKRNKVDRQANNKG
jgi:hypothetical protein